MRQQNVHVMHDPPQQEPGELSDFDAFVLTTEPRLRRALVAAYGYEDGREAAAEALAYAWQHWVRVSEMPNAPGYLFRVGRSSLTRGRRWGRKAPPELSLPPDLQLADPQLADEHRFEPGLPAALAALTERQRIAVVLVHGFSYTLREVADLTETKITTVQNHLDRGLRRLRDQLGVPPANKRAARSES